MVRSITEGLETWKPPAPGIGLNSGTVQCFVGPERTRGELTVVHLKAHRPITAVPPRQAMPEFRSILSSAVVYLPVLLVHIDSTHRTGSCIAVLVGAPGGEIDIPLMHLQLDIAVRMGQIPADSQAAFLGVFGDPGHVKQLPRVVLDARQENERCVTGVLVDIA